MQIDFLWWEGCPSHPEAWNRLQQALSELNVDARVNSVEIKTDQDAEQWRFSGSPTILVNGQDIDPQARPAYRLTCRLYYLDDGRPSPLPSVTMIKRAIQQAQDAKS